MVGVLTQREREVIDKKLSGKSLSQQDSNYLSRYVRPKLREMSLIDSKDLLRRLEYNRKKRHNEEKIKKLVLDNVKDVEVIVLYGSVVYNDWHDYEDIDVIVGVKKKSWKKMRERWEIIWNLQDKAKKKGLNLDVKVFLKKDIIESYGSNPTLIYELQDRKVIYGGLELPRKIRLIKEILKYHMGRSYIVSEGIDEEIMYVDGNEIYSAIRNALIVKLISSKLIDNIYLNNFMKSELSVYLSDSLKKNKANLFQKKIAVIYLNNLIGEVNKIINNLDSEVAWEREL